MSDDKKVHELTEDELMKLVNSSSEVVDMGEVTEAAKFIYDLGIRAGDTKVPAGLVYYTYKLWRGITNKRQPKTVFLRDFSKYFESKRNKSMRYYSLEAEPFDLSDDMFWEMRADLRRTEQHRESKKKKT